MSKQTDHEKITLQCSLKATGKLFPKIDRTRLTDEKVVTKFKQILDATVIPDWCTSLDQRAYFCALSIVEAAAAALPKSQRKKMQEYISEQTFAFITGRRRLAKPLRKAAQRGRHRRLVTRRISRERAYSIERPTISLPTKCLDQHYRGFLRLAAEAQRANDSNDYKGFFDAARDWYNDTRNASSRLVDDDYDVFLNQQATRAAEA
ncbi:unnamed protein product, partial [Prorocentrum cordatum]